MTPKLNTLDHLVLTVADLDRTIAFYRDVLSMVPERFQPKHGPARWALKFGTQKLNLHLAGKEFEPKSRQPTPGSADLCFLSEVPLAEWQVHLARMNVAVEEGPVARTGATGPIISLYLRDPDGNLIEISNRA